MISPIEDTNPPRPFDLSSADDLDRLLRETAGYAAVSLHYGTDHEGRRYASDALRDALRQGFKLVKVTP